MLAFFSFLVAIPAVARVVDGNFDLKVEVIKEFAYDFLSFSSEQKPHSLVRFCKFSGSCGDEMWRLVLILLPGSVA